MEPNSRFHLDDDEIIRQTLIAPLYLSISDWFDGGLNLPPVEEHKQRHGYEVERFIDPPKKDFQCPICFGVVREPRECSRCGVLICNNCYTDYAVHVGIPISLFSHERILKCPTCRTREPFRKPSLVLLKIIGKLIITCKYKSFGCEFACPLSDIKAHQLVCPYKQVTCQNTTCCDKSGPKQQFQSFSVMRSQMGLRYSLPLSTESIACSNACKKTIQVEEYIKNIDSHPDAIAEYFKLLIEWEHYKPNT